MLSNVLYFVIHLEKNIFTAHLGKRVRTNQKQTARPLRPSAPPPPPEEGLQFCLPVPPVTCSLLTGMKAVKWLIQERSVIYSWVKTT